MFRHAGLSAALTATLWATGCGESDDEALQPTPPPSSAAPEAAPAPAPAPVPVLTSAIDIGIALTRTELDAAIRLTTAATFAGAARCDVQIVEIGYRTPTPDGSPAEVSGALMIPSGAGCAGPFPLVSYSRGTDLDRTRSLAQPGDEETRLVSALLAAQGFFVAASDYLGYAKSAAAAHPYLHASSAATTSLDTLRAAREVAAARGIALDGRVFLTGYSQGGHASMAAQRLIETQHAAEFPLAGAGHMSGPYDLVGTATSAVDALPLGDLGSTYYLPFAVTSLQAVYGDLYPTPAAFFEDPYDDTIEGLLPAAPGTTLAELILERKLPLLLGSLVTSEFAAAVRDPASALRRALAENSPLDFGPIAPTLLCGGSRDPVVPFRNARGAAEAFASRGALDVTLLDLEAQSAYAAQLRDDSIPVALNTGYHASLVPPLCLLEVRNRFLLAP